MAFAEDLSQFFDTNDFAVDAVLGTSPARSIKVIFETPTQSAEIYDTSIDGDAPVLHCKTADLTGARNGIAVTVSGESYKIARTAHDGSGTSRVFLK